VENQPIDSAVSDPVIVVNDSPAIVDPAPVQIDVTADPAPVAIDVAVDPAPVVEVVTPEADMTTPPHPSEVFQLVGDVAPAVVDNGAQAQTGEFHPAHSLLDSIETMVAFASSEVNHTVRDLVKKIRAML